MRPACEVFTVNDPTSCYRVAERHYEELRDRLDKGETGWIELDACDDPSGKVFIRLQDITEMFLKPAAFLDACPQHPTRESF